MLLNPFDNDAFNVYELTKAINILSNKYGRMAQLDLFPGKGIRSRTVFVEEKSGVLSLIPSQPVGAPGLQNKTGGRKVRSFVIPHIPLDDVVLPAEYEGIRAFGAEDQLMEMAQVLNDHLQSLKNKHDITLEHLRMGALKGIILDGDGTTTLYNLYTEFGIVAKAVDFALDTESTDVRAKCFEVTRHIEDNLKGEVMSGVRCLCSSGFFDALVSHANVKETFLYQQAATMREDIRKNFQFGGITFEEYRGNADNPDGSTVKFIADNQAHFYPEGTTETFETLFAPADFMESVNTRGQSYYAKQEPRKYNRGVDIHTQSNPLPICYRPGVLVKGTRTS